jgi:hypothetical protein
MQRQFALNREIRETLREELNTLSLTELNYIPPTHNNNIFWNIAHCIAVQQALCYGLSGVHYTVDKSLVKSYRRGTKPEQAVAQKQVDELYELLLDSVDWLHRDWVAGRFETYKPYTVGFGTHLTNINEAITFNNVHEGIHYGYILALKKML